MSWRIRGRGRLYEVGPTESLILLHSFIILSQSASPTPPVAETAAGGGGDEERERGGGRQTTEQGGKNSSACETRDKREKATHPRPSRSSWFSYTSQSTGKHALGELDEDTAAPPLHWGNESFVSSHGGHMTIRILPDVRLCNTE